jgi:hypothetical protein
MCELYTARAVPVAHGMRAAALAKRIFPDRAMLTKSADRGPRKSVPASIALIPGQRATRTLSELSKLSHPGVGDAPHPTLTRESVGEMPRVAVMASVSGSLIMASVPCRQPG